MTELPHTLWILGGVLIYAGFWTLGTGVVLALVALVLEATKRIT